MTRKPSLVAEAGKSGFSLRLHHLLFIAFTIIAGVPLAVLAMWEGSTSLQNELDSVRERHLLVARNLTSTMSRYVHDVEAVFGLTFQSGALTTPVAGLADLLLSLNVVNVCILGPTGQVQATLPGLPDPYARRDVAGAVRRYQGAGGSRAGQNRVKSAASRP